MHQDMDDNKKNVIKEEMDVDSSPSSNTKSNNTLNNDNNEKRKAGDYHVGLYQIKKLIHGMKID